SLAYELHAVLIQEFAAGFVVAVDEQITDSVAVVIPESVRALLIADGVTREDRQVAGKIIPAQLAEPLRKFISPWIPRMQLHAVYFKISQAQLRGVLRRNSEPIHYRLHVASGGVGIKEIDKQTLRFGAGDDQVLTGVGANEPQDFPATRRHL